MLNSVILFEFESRRFYPMQHFRKTEMEAPLPRSILIWIGAHVVRKKAEDRKRDRRKVRFCESHVWSSRDQANSRGRPNLLIGQKNGNRLHNACTHTHTYRHTITCTCTHLLCVSAVLLWVSKLQLSVVSGFTFIKFRTLAELNGKRPLCGAAPSHQLHQSCFKVWLGQQRVNWTRQSKLK